MNNLKLPEKHPVPQLPLPNSNDKMFDVIFKEGQIILTPRKKRRKTAKD